MLPRFSTLLSPILNDSWKQLIRLYSSHPQSIKRPIRQQLCGGGRKRELMDPTGSVAIITGGDSGIGLSTAIELLQNGAQGVVIATNSVESGRCAARRLTREFGEGRAHFIEVDVRNGTQFEEVFKKTIKLYKRLDILFNNAGVLQDKDWEMEIATNLTGVIRGTLLAFQYMGKNACASPECCKDAIVINTAAVEGLQPLPYAPIYSITKHGVVASVQNFGNNFHYQRTGIRVIGLCPGPTETCSIQGVAGRQLNDVFGKATEDYINDQPSQKSEVVALAMLYLIRFASNGSIWVLEDSDMFVAEMPDRKDYTKSVMSFK